MFGKKKGTNIVFQKK